MENVEDPDLQKEFINEFGELHLPEEMEIGEKVEL